MKIARLTLVAAVVAVAVLSTGCATYVSGAKQAITVRSAPPGAHVRCGEQTGTTPMVLRVPKDKAEHIEVTFGRNRQVITLSRVVDPNTYLNFIPPLWPGFVVDAMTGAMIKYEQDEVFVDFRTAQMVRYAR